VTATVERSRKVSRSNVPAWVVTPDGCWSRKSLTEWYRGNSAFSVVRMRGAPGASARAAHRRISKFSASVSMSGNAPSQIRMAAPNGRAKRKRRASRRSKRTVTPAARALARARRSWSADRSIPVTVQPRRASSMAWRPVPQPMSRMVRVRSCPSSASMKSHSATVPRVNTSRSYDSA